MAVLIIDGNNGFPTPTSLTFKKYDITNQDRTMNGTLVVDYIDSKDSINVAWDVLDNTQFNNLLGIINGHKSESNKTFYSLQYVIPGTNGTELSQPKDAYTEEISYYPFYTNDGQIVWRDVSLTFVEV